MDKKAQGLAIETDTPHPDIFVSNKYVGRGVAVKSAYKCSKELQKPIAPK